MSVLEKFLVGVTGVALLTTMLLPGRQTPAVANAFANGTARILGTVMGTTAMKAA